MLPLIRPDLGFDEVAGDLRAVIESGRLTGGPYLAQCEADLAAAVGVGHAVATTSATTALHLALAAAGVAAGDEVILSDFTFPATGNVVVQLGATPVLADSRPDSFALDPDDVAAKITDRTAAIIPVDPFGQPADVPALRPLARAREIPIVEDAACALGASRPDGNCGQRVLAGCFSFHPRKVVTTGEGGAVVTDDDDLADRLRTLRNHGQVPDGEAFSFVASGFNYRLSETAAVLGLAQLRRLDAIIGDRRRTAARYNALLGDLTGVRVPMASDGHNWSYQSYVVMVDDPIDRDGVVRHMRAQGFETTLGTYALHAQPAFARFGYGPGALPHSWRAQNQSLTLPLIPDMTAAQTEATVAALETALRQVGMADAA